MHIRLLSLLLLLFTTAVSCQDYGNMQLKDRLPKTLKEVSGIAIVNEKIIAINDSGNKASLWVYEPHQPLVELRINNAINNDWEDLSYDKASETLYIGDFGNNDNERRDLNIYKVSLKNVDLTIPQNLESTSIPFYYDDQTDYPPKKKNFLYDCEAFIVYQNHFYLFTRNRSKDFNGKTSVYRLPVHGTIKKAIKLAEIEICNDDKDCQVTSAAINDNGTIALLTSDKVFLIHDFHMDFKDYDMDRFDLNHYSQKEGLDFISKAKFYITDERDGSTGQNLYEFSMD